MGIHKHIFEASHPKNITRYPYMRYENFNIEIFIKDLNKKIKNFSIKNTKAVDSQFDKFMFIRVLSSVVNQHAPVKRALRREKRLKLKRWFTRLPPKSIKQKTTCMQI